MYIVLGMRGSLEALTQLPQAWLFISKLAGLHADDAI